MNKEEFIKLAVSSGYGNKAAAEHYVNQHGKPEYTTDDFSRLEERMKQEAPIYISQKNIELTSKEYKYVKKEKIRISSSKGRTIFSRRRRSRRCLCLIASYR